VKTLVRPTNWQARNKRFSASYCMDEREAAAAPVT
jgi:hypothetical protein